MIMYIKYPKESTKKPLDLIGEFSKFARDMRQKYKNQLYVYIQVMNSGKLTFEKYHLQ